MSKSSTLFKDVEYVRPGPRRNPLLVRPVCGKSRASTYDLPGPDFTYGSQPLASQDEGVSTVVAGWTAHVPNPEAVPGRDFVQLNRKAAATGCVSARDIGKFRKTNDVRLRQGHPAVGSNAASSAPLGGISTQERMKSGPWGKDAVFGKPSQPSEPIQDIIGNTYQLNYIREVQEKQKAKTTKRSKGRKVARGPRKVVHTKASLGHTKPRSSDNQPRFKLKQFQNVSSRVNAPQAQRQREQQQKQAAVAAAPATTTAGAQSEGSKSVSTAGTPVPETTPVAAAPQTQE